MSRKFGIEIEAVGVPMADVARALNAAGIPTYIEGYNHTTKSHWKIVTDASLSGQHAFELVSPILEGASGLCQVDTVGKVLTQLGAKVNKSCGLHVHVDARDIDATAMKRVCKMWMKYESCFDSVMPESRRDNMFCRGIREKFQSLDAAFDAIDGARNMAGLRAVMNGTDSFRARYHKLNLESLLRHGTVEFRQHSGTVDAEKMVMWIELVTAFIDCAVTAKAIRANGDGKFDNLLAVTPIPSVRKFYRERRAYFTEAA